MREKYITSKAKIFLRFNKIKSPPVPVEDIIRSAGIKIKYDYKLNKTYAVKHDDKYIILFSPSGNKLADRKELAEKLGFLCLKHPRIEKRTVVGRTADEKIKMFALELLIPDEFIIDLFEKYNLIYVNYLIKLFQVPESMIKEKINKLNY